MREDKELPFEDYTMMPSGLKDDEQEGWVASQFKDDFDCYVALFEESIQLVPGHLYIQLLDFEDGSPKLQVNCVTLSGKLIKTDIDFWKICGSTETESRLREVFQSKSQIRLDTLFKEHASVRETIVDKFIDAPGNGEAFDHFATNVHRFRLNAFKSQPSSGAIDRDLANKMNQLLALLNKVKKGWDRRSKTTDARELLEVDQIIRRASIVMKGVKPEIVDENEVERCLVKFRWQSMNDKSEIDPSQIAEGYYRYCVVNDTANRGFWYACRGMSRFEFVDVPGNDELTNADALEKLKEVVKSNIRESLTQTAKAAADESYIDNLDQLARLANQLKTNPNKTIQRIAGVLITVGVLVVLVSVALPTVPALAPHFASFLASVGGVEVSTALTAGGAAAIGVIGASIGGYGVSQRLKYPSLGGVVADVVNEKRHPTRTRSMMGGFFANKPAAPENPASKGEKMAPRAKGSGFI